MKLTASNFFIRKRNSDLHGTLFATLKLAGIKDFVPENPNKQKIIFCCQQEQIVCRSKHKPSPMIASYEEEIEIEAGSKITGTVTLSNYKQCGLTKAEVAAFQEKYGRLPKGKESHPYRLLNESEFLSMYTRLLANAGLKLISSRTARHPLGVFRISGHNKFLNAIDVKFDAIIEDLDLFTHAWYNGVGRAKTYGFGMLRVGVA